MSTVDFSPLPIDAALPDLTAALRATNAAVLVAPPGAGKTTRVPLVLGGEDWAQKARRILVLEPRRLAARAAAARMAQTLGERVGDTVGLRVRFGSKISQKTRIEIITEGIFTRLILDDPMLDGVAAVIFDEFHERSLDADLGLALARDVQQGLREDLRLIVMSATIDGARIAKLIGGAPVIASEGRAFAVETRYVGRDARAIEPQVADVITRVVRAETGSLLAFLPGAAEIRRTQALLEGRVDASTDIVALYGALAGGEQDRAIAPAPLGRRKIVLATSIAETSITIEGVRIVIDSGLARVPRYEPDVGVTRLETVRVSRAAADQRRGRAGRNSCCGPVVFRARPGRLGQRPRATCLPRSAATPRARRGQGPVARTWGHRRRRPHHRGGPAPAAFAAAAAARAHGGRRRSRWRRGVRRRDRRSHRRARPWRRRRRSPRPPRRACPRPLAARAGRACDGATVGGGCNCSLPPCGELYT
jgi:ATP-dependent helicase HrpB